MGRAIIGVLRLRQFPEPSLIFFLSSDRKRDKGRQERAVDFDKPVFGVAVSLVRDQLAQPLLRGTFRKPGLPVPQNGAKSSRVQ